MEISTWVCAFCAASRLLNLHALQFVIVLRVIIVHFGCYLMKHLQAVCMICYGDFTSSCEIACKGNDFY